MTSVRRMAVRVAAFTVRHASAGSREWAEGLACEVEFIDGDWRALLWAVGSMRVLLERNGVRTGADDVMKPKTPGMIDVAPWILYCELALGSTLDVVKARSGWDRTSTCLCALAWVGWLGNSVANWRRERWEPPFSSDAYLPFQRKELEHKLTRSGTMKRWLPCLAIACWIIGGVMQDEGGLHLHHVSSAVWIVLGILLIPSYIGAAPQKIQRQIVQMDERIAKAEIEKAERMARGGRDKPVYSEHWGRGATSET